MITGKNNQPGKTSGASANGAYSKRYAISQLNKLFERRKSWKMKTDRMMLPLGDGY